MVRFLSWLDREMKAGHEHTECTLAAQLERFRALDPLFVVMADSLLVVVAWARHTHGVGTCLLRAPASTPFPGLRRTVPSSTVRPLVQDPP